MADESLKGRPGGRGPCANLTVIAGGDEEATMRLLVLDGTHKRRVSGKGVDGAVLSEVPDARCVVF